MLSLSDFSTLIYIVRLKEWDEEFAAQTRDELVQKLESGRGKHLARRILEGKADDGDVEDVAMIRSAAGLATAT